MHYPRFQALWKSVKNLIAPGPNQSKMQKLYLALLERKSYALHFEQFVQYCLGNRRVPAVEYLRFQLCLRPFRLQFCDIARLLHSRLPVVPHQFVTRNGFRSRASTFARRQRDAPQCVDPVSRRLPTWLPLPGEPYKFNMIFRRNTR